MGQPITFFATNTDPISAGVGAVGWACGCGAWYGNDDVPTRIRFRQPGTISLTRTKILTNTMTQASGAITLHKNGSPVGALSIPAGVTGYLEDLATAVSVAAGDDFQFYVQGNGFGDISLQGVGVVFTPSGNTMSRLTSMGNDDMGAGTVYFPVWGPLNDGWNARPEIDAQVRSPIPGTISNLLVRLDSNTTTGTSTCRFRLNNANTALSVSIDAGLTGLFEDTSTTVVITANDYINHVMVGPGGGGNLSVRNICVDFEGENPDLTIAGGSVTAAFNPLPGADDFGAFQGRFENRTPESDVQLTVGVTTTLSGLGINVYDNNSTDGTCHYRLRRNGANGTCDVTIPPLATGHFQDLSGADLLEPDDEVNFAGAQGGSTATGISASTFYYAIGGVSAGSPVPPGSPSPGSPGSPSPGAQGIIGPLAWVEWPRRVIG